MKDQTYNIVGLDGQEYENVEYDLIREWYAARLINEESLVFSQQHGQWKKIMNVFPLADFNEARRSLQEQNVANYAFPENERNLNSDWYVNESPQSFNNRPFQPNGNFDRKPPRSSSAWKTVLVIFGVVILGFGGLASVGAYFLGKVSRTQAINKASEAGKEKFFAELKNYEIPGDEFVDEQSGAKIKLPKGWRMLKPDNPLMPIHNLDESNADLEKDGITDTTMMATDKLANQVLLAEVVHFPDRLDNVQFFDQGVGLVEREIQKQSVVGTYKRILETTIPLDNRMAKKIVYERVTSAKNPRAAEFGITVDNDPIKGQIIVLSSDYHAVILQMWTKKDIFDNAVADFDFFEKNLTIPKTKLLDYKSDVK
jgi:hypothetical protein